MDLDKIRFIGRHTKKNGYDYFSYSGCGFEFVVTPNSLNCSVELNLISETREHDHQYIAIFINNIFHSKEKLVAGLNVKKIILTNAAKYNLIKIIKLNESYLSSIYLKEIALEDAFFGKITPSNKKIIGFFGDSITCGFGLSELYGQEFKMETEDFTKTYAFLASFALNMDYSIVARSGISVAIPIFVNKTFNEIYETIDMFIKCRDNQKLDYAVINLGTNDNSAYFQVIKDDDKPHALIKFKNAYLKLVHKIVRDNPGVKIIMCYNMVKLEEVIIKSLKEIEKHINASYRIKCKLVEFIPNSDGACSHPYQTAHEINSKILIDAITNL